MRISSSAVMIATLLLWHTPAAACGPEFPDMPLVWYRNEALLAAPRTSFAEQLKLLWEPPTDNLPVDEERGPDEGRAEAEIDGLPSGSVEAIRAMRNETDGAAAYAFGEGLPPAIRYYTAGAVSFRAHALNDADRYFRAVLELSPGERRPREVWSTFMLGRIAAAQNNAVAASEFFGHTRSLVRAGAADPLGLAVESLGEEARVDLNLGRSGAAVRLYLEQASYGSGRAINSLSRVAARILDDPTLFSDAVRDRGSRQLIALYLQAKDTPSFPSFLSSDDEEVEDAGPETESRQATPWREADASVRPVADLLADAIQEGEPAAGWLAAAAYGNGRFDLAERMAARSPGGLSAWVRAKLALRRGDEASALVDYTEAIRALTPAGARETSGDRSELEAELGLLRLSRGDYVEALRLLYNAGDGVWGSTAFVAERVLTEEELRTFVDEYVVAPTPEELAQAFEYGTEIPAASLRAILARRLMRKDRADEAVAYFDDEYLRSAAEEFVKARNRATSRWRGSVARAEAWFDAAAIARFDGMELFGTELAPDFAVIGGSFPAMSDRDELEAGDFVTQDELSRVGASRADPYTRYHYRVTAVRLAGHAADFVPSSSQAFAAILCKATGWVLDDNPELGQELYARYIREGPYVLWAKRFGRACPQPDFAAVQRRLWSERLQPAADLLARIVGVWNRLAGSVRVVVLDNAERRPSGAHRNASIHTQPEWGDYDKLASRMK